MRWLSSRNNQQRDIVDLFSAIIFVVPDDNPFIEAESGSASTLVLFSAIADDKLIALIMS